MPRKTEIDPAIEAAIWNQKMVEYMFELVREKSELSGDDFAAICRRHEVPPMLIRKASPVLIKSFKNQGYLRRITGKFVVSDRSGKPLQVYQCQPSKGALK